MHSTQIERVINLIRRTGDRCILMDNHSEDVLVMMQLGEYEKLLDGDSDKKSLVDMSEREMMDKMNREIAYWRSVHVNEDVEKDSFVENKKTEMYLSPEKDRKPVDDWSPVEEMKSTVGLEEDLEVGEVKNVESAEWEEDLVPEMEVAKETTFLAEDSIENNNFKMEETLSDLSEEDQETFLLEPV